jgi:lactam utilization protein B
MKNLQKKTLPSMPDNKRFGRHSLNKQESELPPDVLNQINWIKKEIETNKKENR